MNLIELVDIANKLYSIDIDDEEDKKNKKKSEYFNNEINVIEKEKNNLKERENSLSISDKNKRK